MTPITPEAQAAVGELAKQLEESLKVAKAACDENARLKTDLARKDQIILEKVASAKPAAQPEAIAALVTNLVEKGFLAKEAAVTTTEHLAQDPNNLVKLATKLASLSLPSSTQGRGIAKNETAPEKKASASDQDGWTDVIRTGAN